MKRSSGILLPIFSLPSRYGIGNLGREAYKFIDFLEKAGQSHWQILPLGPTGFGDSPYQSFSTFAGNPYFIDFDGLISEGLLLREEAESVIWGSNQDKVDYGAIYDNREEVLKKAFRRFSAKGWREEEFLEFCMDNKDWLEDYGLFMALKKHSDMKPWYQWKDEALRTRKPEAIKEYRELLSEEVKYHRFVQFVFFDQWEKLKNYAHVKGVKIIGDLPIYISMDSADAWIGTKLLKFNERLEPLWVAGVPPDYFAEKGQLWGNPIYDWNKMKKDGYAWWMKRLEAAAKMFDVLRLDHFRGFESYWQVPYGKADAVMGEWVKGPGWNFLKRVKKKFPGLEIIAEDLGVLNDEVHKLVNKTGFPGMKVLQFAFASGNSCEHLPHEHIGNSVVYTGTHDNNTIKGWLEEDATEEERDFAAKYFGLGRGGGVAGSGGFEGYGNNDKWSLGMIRGAMRSVADLCIIPMQDYLDKPSSARINTPSTVGENWQWRLSEDELTEGLAGFIKDLTFVYGREQ